MRLSIFTSSAFAALTTAQSQFLSSLLLTNPDLSTFTATLGNVSSFAATLNSQNGNITIFAPTNQAFEALSAGGASSEGQAVKDRNKDAIEALLAYHVLKGTYLAANFQDALKFADTTFSRSGPGFETKVTGGQKLGLVRQAGNLRVYSGDMESSNVVQNNVPLTPGSSDGIPGVTVHKIDKILTVPHNLSSTLTRLPQLNASAALDALKNASLVATLEGLQDMTVFIPNNAAFLAIGSALQDETLSKVLKYHAIEGSVVFSSDVANTTVKTVQGSDLKLSVGTGGKVYVDRARVVVPNILLSNGVAHVIDVVLNPDAADVNRDTLNPTASIAPAFSGTSTVRTKVPFATTTETKAAGVSKVAVGLGAVVGMGVALAL